MNILDILKNGLGGGALQAIQGKPQMGPGGLLGMAAGGGQAPMGGLLGMVQQGLMQHGQQTGQGAPPQGLDPQIMALIQHLMGNRNGAA